MSKSKLTTTIIAAAFCAVTAVQAATFTISTNAPTANVVESFNAQDYAGSITIGGMGPNRIELSGTKNRYAGQSVTISPTNNVEADSITFRAHNNLNFNDGGTNTFELYVVANNTAVGSYTYDFSTNSISAGDYLTFDLGGVDLDAGVEYEFQMYYSEFDDDNKLSFERDQGGNSYAGGALFSGADTNAAISMPVSNAWLGGTSDMTFFIQGTATPYSPPIVSSATAPDLGDVIEYYEDTPSGSIAVRRNGSADNSCGQTFSVTTDTSVAINAITVRAHNDLDFGGDATTRTLLIALLKDIDGNGKCEAQIGSTYSFDLTGQDVASAGDYVTFNLDTPISNLVAGTYGFDLYFGEETAGNTFAVKRMLNDGTYAGGGQIYRTAPSPFPYLDLSPSSVTNDFIFYVHGETLDWVPPVTVSTNVPTGNMLESFNAQDYAGSITINGMGPARKQLGTVASDNRMAGQSLTIDQGANVLASSISFRMYNNLNFNDGGTNTFELYIVTNNTTVGSYTYDLSLLNLTAGDYVSFDLEDIELESGIQYEFQMYYSEFDDDNNFLFERDSGGNSYTNGALFSKGDTSAVISMPQDNIGLGGVNDMTFFLQGTVISSSDPYDDWAAGYPGFTDTDLESDPEGDGLNNLMEYALNGDPTANDAASVKPAVSTDGSWFVHVHTERVGDATLSYAVELDQNANLPSASWATTGIEYVDESAVSGDYKSVTNRTDNTDSQEFIRLQVEK